MHVGSCLRENIRILADRVTLNLIIVCGVQCREELIRLIRYFIICLAANRVGNSHANQLCRIPILTTPAMDKFDVDVDLNIDITVPA